MSEEHRQLKVTHPPCSLLQPASSTKSAVSPCLLQINSLLSEERDQSCSRQAAQALRHQPLYNFARPRIMKPLPFRLSSACGQGRHKEGNIELVWFPNPLAAGTFSSQMGTLSNRELTKVGKSFLVPLIIPPLSLDLTFSLPSCLVSCTKESLKRPSSRIG